MNADEFFYKILSEALPCPVSTLPAGGCYETYATYQEASGNFTAYASNEPARISHLMQVHIFSRAMDGTHRALLTVAVRALKAAHVRIRGWSGDMYETETGYHHIAVTCEWTERA